MLANATHSAENLAYALHDHLDLESKPVKATPPRSTSDLRTYIQHLLETGLGVHDASEEEIDRLVNHPQAWPASYAFADIISRRAQVGWSTHGHSAVDVPIFASSPKHASPLIGNHENTAIGEFISDYLDVDVDAVTKELREQGVVMEKTRKWMGEPISDDRAGNHGDHYEGDFKLRKRDCGCGLH